METINNSFSLIEEITKRLTSTFEDYDKAISEGKTFGYAGLPGALLEVKKYGIDKVFFVCKDYHGRYEDDDCTFTYWNELTKTFFTDYWTTAAACPTFGYYEEMINFTTAWNAGLINKEAYLAKVKEAVLEKIENTAFSCKDPEDFSFRVEVTGGKKWRGTGYYVDAYETEYHFAQPMFRSRYYGSPSDFGVSKTKVAVIYDPVTNTLNECNAQYIKYLDIDEIMTSYKAWAKEIVEKSTSDSVMISTDNLDIKEDYSLETFLYKWFNEHKVDTSTASYPAQEARDKKKADFKEQKMKELIEWVRNNTDKEAEDIVGLAEHIFNKKYNS